MGSSLEGVYRGDSLDSRSRVLSSDRGGRQVPDVAQTPQFDMDRNQMTRDLGRSLHTKLMPH